MTYYYAQIVWNDGAGEMLDNSKIKYAPVIKSSVFNGADVPCWTIHIINKSCKKGENFLDFHFLSPDIPDVFAIGDAFTLWENSCLLAKGTIIKKYN